MPLTSTAATKKVIRDRLFDFTPLVGNDLRTRLGGRLYWRKPSEQPDLGMPYAALRLINLQRSWESLALKVNGQLEILWFANSQKDGDMNALEAAADVAEQAMLYWREAFPDGTMIHSQAGLVRDHLDPFPDTSARDTSQIRHLFDLQWWPQYLTQYPYGGT